MEALFIVPCMVSPNINERLVPALAKMVERNIVLNNSGLFQQAAFKKYSSNKSWIKKLISRESSGDIDETIPTYLMSEYNINEGTTKFDNITDLFNSKTLNETNLLEANAKTINYRNLRDMDLEQDFTNIQVIQKYNYERFLQAQDQEEAQKWQERINSADDRLTDIMSLAIKAKDSSARARGDENKMAFDKEKFKKEFNHSLDEFDLKTKMEIRKDARDAAKSKLERKKLNDELSSLKQAQAQVGTVSSGQADYRPNMSYSKVDDIQDPGNITFFKQISIEPTFIDIPMNIVVSKDLKGNLQKQYMEVRVGVKCIPYIIDNVTNIMFLLRESKHVNFIERKFKNALRSVNKRIWFTKARAINRHGYVDPREAVNTIKYTPSRKEMENTKRVAKMFSTNKSPNWSTMIALSSFDLSDEELSDFVRNYKRMTEYLIGDIIIVNETKESAYFCTVRMNSCQELSFAYLKKILNMDNILDYNAVARQANPWKSEARPRKSRLKRVFRGK